MILQRKMKLMELKERQDEMNQRKIRQAKSFEELQKRAEVSSRSLLHLFTPIFVAISEKYCKKIKQANEES